MRRSRRLPVGEGAVWTTDISEFLAGASLPYTARYTLVHLEGTDYTVEVSLDGGQLDTSDTETSGTQVSGNVTLTGTFTGDAANGLDRATSVELTFAVTTTEDGETSTLKAAVVIDYVSTPR